MPWVAYEASRRRRWRDARGPVKRFVFWMVLLLLFDALTCQSLRAMIQPVSIQASGATASPAACSGAGPVVGNACEGQQQNNSSTQNSVNLSLTPLPTCQAVFDPAMTGPCARRDP
jgi:hypothetical protein